MMTNVALSLQWCVPHTVYKLGVGGCAVGNGGGIVDGENKMGLRVWKCERDVRNRKSARGL